MNQENQILPMSVTLTDSQINDLARPLSVIIEAFYQNPENEKKFQEWLKGQSTDLMEVSSPNHNYNSQLRE